MRPDRLAWHRGLAGALVGKGFQNSRLAEECVAQSGTQLHAKDCRDALELGWRAQLGLPEMTHNTWRWQSLNPDGYAA